MEEKNLVKATPLENQASIFGAGFIGFGLGVLLATFVGKWGVAVMLLGIVMHAWGMFKTHRRSR